MEEQRAAGKQRQRTRQPVNSEVVSRIRHMCFSSAHFWRPTDGRKKKSAPQCLSLFHWICESLSAWFGPRGKRRGTELIIGASLKHSIVLRNCCEMEIKRVDFRNKCKYRAEGASNWPDTRTATGCFRGWKTGHVLERAKHWFQITWFVWIGLWFLLRSGTTGLFSRLIGNLFTDKSAILN